MFTNSFTETNTSVITTDYSDTIDLERAESLSIHAVIDVNTPSAAVCASATDINATTNLFTSVAHGFVTGLKVQVTTSTTLPTGISAITDYFIVKIDADTFKLSDTLAHALAGTNLIDISDVGTGNQTFTPVAIAGGSIELQKSNDGTNFVIEGSATNVTADANVFLEKDRPTFKFARVKLTLTAGSISAVYNVVVKH